MGYSNFKVTVWSKYIQQELERKCKLVDDCWKQFEGEAKKGEQVKILGIGQPAVKNYTGAAIDPPEVVEDNSQMLLIDQAKYFNFMVDDVDKAQSVPGLMEALMDEATKMMARARDVFVASLVTGAANTSTPAAITTAAGARSAIDLALLTLRENDVDVEDEVTITIAPFLYQLFKSNLIEVQTDNKALIEKGIVGMYDNCMVKVSNNLYTSGGYTYMPVRTKRAIAFAGGIDKVEAYRPQDSFSDAMKGLNVFGGKMVRPKECYVIAGKKS